MLKLLADKVFPSREEPYKMTDRRELRVGDRHLGNRICAFFDEKVSGEERKFLIAEVQYLESYLRQIVQYDQMGEHKPSIEKYHANMMAIHTYLIISEILMSSGARSLRRISRLSERSGRESLEKESAKPRVILDTKPLIKLFAQEEGWETVQKPWPR